MNHHPKPLRHFIENEIKLIATFEDGHTHGSWKDPGNYISHTGLVKDYWINKGVRRFQFLPIANNLICIDIDRKKGKDGLRDLYQVFSKKKLAMPEYLLDITRHPAHTQTPSNGFHLYFRYVGKELYPKTNITPGLEIVHDNHLLTAPGSQKEGKPYLFFGDLNKAPIFPYVLEEFVVEVNKKKKLKPSITWTYDNNNKQYAHMSLEKIEQTIIKQGRYSPESSRNEFAFAFAIFAKKKGYSEQEIEAYLANRMQAEDFTAREIQSTVRSAFKR